MHYSNPEQLYSIAGSEFSFLFSSTAHKSPYDNNEKATDIETVPVHILIFFLCSTLSQTQPMVYFFSISTQTNTSNFIGL